MGILFSKVWAALFGGVKDVKVVIVGLNNAGKTTTLYQLHCGEVVATQPTIGSNVEEVTRGKVRFQCWDLGGQENLRSAWSTYYINSNAVVLVVDSSDRARMPAVKTELAKLLAHADLAPAALLVLANKQDVQGAMTAAEMTEALGLTAIRSHPWHLEPCCALTGEGCNEGMDWVAQTIASRR